jgi:hypothetical protein
MISFSNFIFHDAYWQGLVSPRHPAENRRLSERSAAAGWPTLLQKCIPTVNKMAWLIKSYVPSAVCPEMRPAVEGLLPATVRAGPYPNW